MASIVIHLGYQLEKQLQEVASTEGVSVEQLCTRAVTDLLRRHADSVPGASDEDPYAPLQRMVGLVREGPADASVRHDLRDEDQQ